MHKLRDDGPNYALADDDVEETVVPHPPVVQSHSRGASLDDIVEAQVINMILDARVSNLVGSDSKSYVFHGAFVSAAVQTAAALREAGLLRSYR